MPIFVSSDVLTPFEPLLGHVVIGEAGEASNFVADLNQVLRVRAAGYLSPVPGQHQRSEQKSTQGAGSADDKASVTPIISGVKSFAGLVMGTVTLDGWATSENTKLGSTAGLSILKNCILCLLNGTLGQRGLLMQRIQIYNIGVRCTGMVVDFSVWLPSVRSGGGASCAGEKRNADEIYSGCVKEALQRLSNGEVKQYFPLFIFGNSTVESGLKSMVQMPMAAPAAVPDEDQAVDTLQPKDVCEMLLCTTKQKKRKGVPYCGTCRKFMEETVKWYCDTYHRHPAKEKDKFVPAVRSERYQCKHPKTTPCDCKACHSLRRFEEMYPKCESKLDEFKRRTYMFESHEKGASSSNRKSSSGGTTKQSSDKGEKKGERKAAKASSSSASGRRVTMRDAKHSEASTDEVDLGEVHYSVPGRSIPDAQLTAFVDMGDSVVDSMSSMGGVRATQYNVNGVDRDDQRAMATAMPPKMPSVSSMVPEPGSAAPGLSETGTTPRGRRRRKRSNSWNLGRLGLETAQKSRMVSGANDDVLSNLLPNFLFQTGPQVKDSDQHVGVLNQNSAVNDCALEFESESLYKELCLEDPLTFSALESVATTAQLNTWLCNVCASWNHPSHGRCTRCNNPRIG